MDITLRIGQQGDITVSANGTDTPVGSIDEALDSIRALAEEAMAGTSGGQQAPAPADMSGAPVDDQTAQEQGMMQGFKAPRG